MLKRNWLQDKDLERMTGNLGICCCWSKKLKLYLSLWPTAFLSFFCRTSLLILRKFFTISEGRSKEKWTRGEQFPVNSFTLLLTKLERICSSYLQLLSYESQRDPFFHWRSWLKSWTLPSILRDGCKNISSITLWMIRDNDLSSRDFKQYFLFLRNYE